MHNSQEIANTIKRYCKIKKITIGKLLAACNLSVNTLSSMQSGGYYPRLEAIAKIADYLDCSIDYLMGRTDVPEINKKESNVINITPREDFAGELAAFGGDFVSNKKPKTPEIL